MKFTDILLELQKMEKRIIIAKCGVFMTAIGRDAILLNKLFGLKLTCLKPGICKVGIPVSNIIFKWTTKRTFYRKLYKPMLCKYLKTHKE